MIGNGAFGVEGTGKRQLMKRIGIGKRLLHSCESREARRERRVIAERRTRHRQVLSQALNTVSAVEAKLPQRICSVGSGRLPSTSTAVERFFRAFQRLYGTRGGLHAVRSAKRELLLFLVVSVCTPHATTGQAPIEVIMPEARSMPLYRLIHDPFRALQERGDVKREVEMADVLRPQEAAA